MMVIQPRVRRFTASVTGRVPSSAASFRATSCARQFRVSRYQPEPRPAAGDKSSNLPYVASETSRPAAPRARADRCTGRHHHATDGGDQNPHRLILAYWPPTRTVDQPANRKRWGGSVCSVCVAGASYSCVRAGAGCDGRAAGGRCWGAAHGCGAAAGGPGRGRRAGGRSGPGGRRAAAHRHSAGGLRPERAGPGGRPLVSGGLPAIPGRPGPGHRPGGRGAARGAG